MNQSKSIAKVTFLAYTGAMADVIFNPGKKNDKVTVPSGTILTLQGGPVTSLILLHTGMAEILDHPGPLLGQSSQELVQESLRVGLFKGESICGVSGFFGSEPDRFTIRTISECQVSSIPVTTAEAMAGIQGKKPLIMQILRAFQRRIESAVFLMNSYKDLWHRLASIADSIALAQEWPRALGKTPDPTQTQANRMTQGLPEYAKNLRNAAASKKLSLLADWDPNVFLDTMKYALDRFSEFEEITVESLIDYPQYLFLKRLVSRTDEVLLPLFDKDEPSVYYIFQFLSQNLDKLLHQNKTLAMAIRDLAAKVYDKNGWVDQVFSLMAQGGDKKKISVFLHYLWKFSVPFHSDMQKLLDVNLSKLYPAFGRLNQYRTEPSNLPSEGPSDQALETEGSATGEIQLNTSEAQVTTPKPSQAFIQNLKDYPKRLALFGELGPNFEDEWLGLVEEFKKLPDRLITEPHALQVRTKFAAAYWKLYEACFLKSIERGFKDPLPGYMLHFGIVDKDLLTEEELAHLEHFWEEALMVESPIPVMTLPYFLEKIYLGHINPSVSEMGESFAEVLRTQAKLTPKERLAARIWENTPEDKAGYEIRIIASNIAGLLSGSKKRSVPALCTEGIAGNIVRNFMDPPHISEYIDSIRSRDFTLFAREVVSKSSAGNDLIQKEVLPNIVLYPCAGTRGMMWGEFDGTKKDSAARFFLPLFFNGNRTETIVELLAHLRWEICKTAAGHNWMDPVEGGLTGMYYDYITYYKKNPNLSLAHKETLKDFIARTRSDKDRFAMDYADWVIHEYDSKVRLNPVAREIFYRFCPFPKEVRTEMAKKGLYMDLETKYQNRTRKDILSLETRLKKFERSGQEIPEDIQAYMALLLR